MITTMSATTVEPTTIEHLDFVPGCDGTIINNGERKCDAPAELIRFKACGCSIPNCVPCRNMIKAFVRLRLMQGERSFLCVLCDQVIYGVESYWDITIREEPL